MPYASILNFEDVDILCAWIGHPSEKLWPFQFLKSFLCSISCTSIYYWPESDIQVRSYDHLNLPCALMLNFENLGILGAWVRHLSEKLWQSESHESINCSISSLSIHYWLESDICVKRYGRLDFPSAFMLNVKHLEILCAWIRHPCEKFCPFEFLKCFYYSISRVSIYYWPKSNIRVKSYGHLNLPCTWMFNFEHLNILCVWIGPLSESYDNLNFSRASVV